MIRNKYVNIYLKNLQNSCFFVDPLTSSMTLMDLYSSLSVVDIFICGFSYTFYGLIHKPSFWSTSRSFSHYLLLSVRRFPLCEL